MHAEYPESVMLFVACWQLYAVLLVWCVLSSLLRAVLCCAMLCYSAAEQVVALEGGTPMMS
jgi:hypothetical protein